jgi:regulator of sirC expression with transglutaminase-like and TPR domain
VSGATERFAALVGGDSKDFALDEAALLIARHAHPDLDEAVPLAELDRLAATVHADTADAVASALFHEGGLTGNTVDYADPRNSYLDDVLARRLGIPITLSVVMVEVGRRRGVALAGVGMPGHFLVRTTAGEPTWYDPFHGGRALDEAGCRDVFEQVIGRRAAFSPEMLAPVPARAIVTRMLANLEQTFVQRDPASLPWVVRLRLLVPGLPVDERRRLAAVLRDAGRFGEAAAELDRLASEVGGTAGEQLGREAAAARARAN